MGTHPKVCVLSSFLFLLIFGTVTCLSDGDDLEDTPQNVSVSEGESVLLPCKAHNDSTVKQCKWLWVAESSGNPILVEEFPGFGERNSDCSLYIKNITHDHQGLWSCVVKLQNRTTIRPKSAYVNVYKRFIFKDTPSNVTVYEGDSVTIPCSSVDEMELCRWFFQRDNSSMWENRTWFENKNDCSLTLNDVSKTDSGFFKCGIKRIAIDELVEAQPIFLEVDGDRPFEFTQAPVDSTFETNSTGSIQCQTKSEVQECRWFWQPQGYGIEWRVKMRQFPPEDGHNCALQFRDISTEPEGLWICSVLPYNSTEYVYAEPVSLTIKTEMEVTVLTRAVAVAEGMPATLRCEVESDEVEECRWRWHHFGEADQPTIIVRSFPPFGNLNRDCSIQFASVMHEQQGVWVCGVRLRNENVFKEYMPTTVSLRLPGKIRIVELSQNKIIAEKETVELICKSASIVDECVWSLTPSNKTYNPTRIEFVPDQYDRRNCSMLLKNVAKKHDGQWKCLMRAERTDRTLEIESEPVLVTVIKPEKIKFDKVVREIEVLPGQQNRLSCIVSHPVEMCQWKWAGGSQSVKKEFPPVDGVDCSLNVSDMDVLRNGQWQCGAKNIGQQNYHWGPLTTLHVIHSENISTRFWISAYSSHLYLVCRLRTLAPLDNVQCHWTHPLQRNMSQELDSRYEMSFDKESGECVLVFEYMMSDLGQWECLFTIETENGTWQLGDAKFLMLNNPDNIRLRWVVGLMAAVILILSISLAVVSLYTCPRRDSRASAISVSGNKYKEKDQQSKICNPVTMKQTARYTEQPSRIDFRFEENPNPAHIQYITPSCSSTTNHLYERVGRLSSSSPTHKTFYQNISD